MVRWLGRLVLVMSGLGVTGCLPDVGPECASEVDCPRAGQSCIGGLCITRSTVDSQVDAARSDSGSGDRRDSSAPDRDATIGADAGPCMPMTEQCDGQDNDCDGFTDEGPDGLALREPCYTADDPETQGVGLCRGGQRVCIEGAFSVCEGQIVPVPEVCGPGVRDCRVCNGQDDDCDGLTDEELTQECGDMRVLGRCRPGTQRCMFGTFGSCEGAIGPAREICDQQDNDCDGAFDEDPSEACECGPDSPGRDCYEGEAGTEQILPCRPGFQVCEGMTYGACEDSIVPVEEVCNQVNDDCDEAVDEGLGGDECTLGIGACKRDGRTACSPGGIVCNVQPGAPSAERCNSVDDDCDGRTDEDFAIGAPCEVGFGQCQARGVLACNDAGLVECSARPGEPRLEVCNGADDDCDEVIDEGEDGEALTETCYETRDGAALEGRPGRGQCVEGARRCVAGRFGACEGAAGPLAEACNNLDDDCNGVVDDVEGGCGCQIGESQPCYEGAADNAGVGACARGMQACIALDDGGTGFGPCVGSVAPQPEACNEIDDDCDGETDEGTFGDCTVGNGECEAAGRSACINGRLICDASAGAPQDEICDNRDNDCDGVIDNGIEGEACVVGEGICVAPGQEICIEGGWMCMGDPGDPAPEICNGQDDDCDGTVDDIDPEPCTVGEGACEAPGVFVCAGPERVCMGEPGVPGDEVCNGIDDDCNGVVDDIAPEPCRVDAGPCPGEGTLICVEREVVCFVEPPDVPEACDGRDNDCDGVTDEDTDALCPGAPNAVGRCGEGACIVECAAGWTDDNDDLADGCERGSDAPIDGQVIAGQQAAGAPGLLAIASRPGTDDVLVVWRDVGGQFLMSRDGGAAEVLLQGAVINGANSTRLQVLGVERGFIVLGISEVGPGTYSAVIGDIEVGDDGLVLPEAPAIAGPFGAIPTITPAPGDIGGSLLVWIEGARGQMSGPGHVRAQAREFGGQQFGAATEYPNAGEGWAAAGPLVGAVHQGEPLVLGLQGNRNNLGLRAFFLDRNVESSQGLGIMRDAAASIALAAAGGDVSFVAVLGSAALNTAKIDGNTPGVGRIDTEDIALTSGSVALSPVGPLVFGISDDGELGCLPYDPGGRDPSLVSGPHPQVSVAGGGGGLTTAVATHTDAGRVLIAWLDGAGMVRYGQSSCR